ncbi:MAG: aldehyde dehydrogenase family protein [Armatimonadetes bacterium]|nr:aldehyde dehydrogenase family protein [Armatimonadota bacterium]
MTELTQLQPGMPILYGGNRLTQVPVEIAERFRPGDRLLVVQRTGELLHVPQAQWEIAAGAVRRALDAFHQLGAVEDERITRFYEEFASRLEDETTWSAIAEANAADVDRAKGRGRSTTRLVADEKMRRAMIDGLREWREAPSSRGQVIETVRHDGWSVEQVKGGYGVVGFVFEGRPNVFADATGVLRSGNTTVMRIGGDALGTAQAIVEVALRPALRASGLPEGAVTLVESPEHAAGWALFSQPELGLAVARGSGRSVALLGSLASQAGIPVSLHGTGGAWIVADATADPKWLRSVVYHSTDRKVCNTLNVLCLPRSRAGEWVPVALDALEERGEKLGHGYKLHVAEGSEAYVPGELFTRTAGVRRAEGVVEEPVAEVLPNDQLGREWEWEGTPEVTLKVVEDTDEAVALFNAHSPRFAASLVSRDPAARERFFRAVDSPFVGNGFTRWVDGQYALNRPELGLSNWEYGRLFARSGILSGDSVYTVRLRVKQDHPDIHR